MIGVKTSIHLHEGFPATGAGIPSLALQAGCSHQEVAAGETPPVLLLFQHQDQYKGFSPVASYSNEAAEQS